MYAPNQSKCAEHRGSSKVCHSAQALKVVYHVSIKYDKAICHSQTNTIRLFVILKPHVLIRARNDRANPIVGKANKLTELALNGSARK
jgi:hypothetical protein